MITIKNIRYPQIILLFSVFIFAIIPAHSQTKYWSMVDSIRFNGYAPDYVAISCADSNNCNAVMHLGGRDTYNRVTSDGGKSWFFTLQDTTVWGFDSSGTKKKVIYFPNPPHSMAYPDTNLCVIVCDSGAYWRSTDKCRTWRKDTISPHLALGLISMPNAKTGGVLGDYEPLKKEVPNLYITNDSAKTWWLTSVSILDSTKTVWTYFDLFVLDSLTYRLIGYRKEKTSCLFGTDDGGINWEFYSTFPIPANSIYFLSKKNGWASGSRQYAQYKYKDVILHTTDGGYNWKVVIDTTIGLDSYGLNRIVFADSLHGTAFGTFGRIWRTVDGGSTWEVVDKLQVNNLVRSLKDISMPSSLTIFAVDAISGHIYKFSPFFSDIPETTSETFDFQIFPNPAEEYIEISVGSRHAVTYYPEIQIFNVFGEKIPPSLTTSATPQEGNLLLDVSMLPSGVYFVRVGDKVGKFVKI